MITAKQQLVAIGASAGGVEAILKVLPMLHHDFQVPVAIVLHVPDKPSVNFSHVISTFVNRKVYEVEDKMPIEDGAIYLAPGGYHTFVDKDGVFSLSQDEPVNFSRPSIDLFFQSAAQAYGKNLMAVLLTGANKDGAEGLKMVQQLKGTTIIQDPNEAQARTMPDAAAALLKPDHIVELEHLSDLLQSLHQDHVKEFEQ